MIKSIYIENFKSIKEVNVKLPHYGIIVGKNGVGKSNFIKAIKYIRDLAVGQSTGTIQPESSLLPNELFNFNASEKKQKFKVDLIDKNENIFHLESTLSLSNETKENQKIVIEKEYLYKNEKLIYRRDQGEIYDAENNKVKLIIDADKLLLPSYKDSDAQSAKILFQEVIVLNAIEDSISQPISVVSKKQKLTLPDIIYKLKAEKPGDYENFVKIIKKMIPNFSAIDQVITTSAVNKDEKLYLWLLQQENLKSLLSPLSVSTGDLKTLFLIALSIGFRENSTLIFEEIENSLHPERLADLIERLQHISQIKGNQIIFSSHSPIAINSTAPQNILYVKRNENWDTIIENLRSSKEVANVEKMLNGGMTNFEIFTN